MPNCALYMLITCAKKRNMTDKLVEIHDLNFVSAIISYGIIHFPKHHIKEHGNLIRDNISLKWKYEIHYHISYKY